MEYTVQKLSRLAGISARTLRYYDQIGLLKPARVNSSGYRIYGAAEVDMLQQILFFRELGFSLENIGEIISNPSFEVIQALRDHHGKLLEKKAQIDLLIRNVENSIAQKEGKIFMSDKEKFQGFKRQLLEENEQKYGAEARAKYGAQTVEKSNQKFMGMSEKQYQEVTRLNEEFLQTLSAAFETGDPGGELAQRAADLHRQWLSYYWNEYNKDAHAGLARMYVEDKRFTDYYDKGKAGTAAFLRDAIEIYTNNFDR